MTRKFLACLCVIAAAGLSGCSQGGELAIPKVVIISGGTSTVSAQAAALGGAVPSGTAITFIGDIVRLRGLHFRSDMRIYLGMNNALARRPDSLLTTLRDFLPAGPFVYTDPVTSVETILEFEVNFEFIREDEALIVIPPEVACNAAFTNPILRVFGDKGSSVPVTDVYFIAGPRCIALTPREGLDIGGYSVIVHGDFFSPYTQVGVRYRDPADGVVRVLGDDPTDDIVEHWIDRYTLVVTAWPGVVPSAIFGLTDELPADVILFESIEAITGNVALEPSLNGKGACEALQPQGDVPLNAFGTRNTEKTDGFLYLPTGVTAPPLIQALTPDSGVEVGGNMVVIHGQQFDAFTVDLSNPADPGVGIECPPGSGEFISPLAASLVNRQTIVVTMPPCPVDIPQKVDICLRNKYTIDNAGNLGGLQTTGPSGTCVVFGDVYTYVPIPPIVPPVVTAIYPSSGAPQPQGCGHDYGLESLMVVGDWFDGDTTLNGGFEFLLPDGTVLQSLRTILHNRNLLEVFTTRLPASVYPLSSDLLAGVRVRNVVGHADFADAMLFKATPDAALPPVLSDLCPKSGPVAGGNRVLVIGANFDTDTRVRFGAAFSTDVQYVHAGLLIAVVPPGGGPGAESVTVLDGADASASILYARTATPPARCPTLGALAPDEGSSTGGYSILAYGIDFTPTTQVEFGVSSGNFSRDLFYLSDVFVRVEVPEAFPDQIGATLAVGATDPLNGCTEAIKTVPFTYVAASMAAPEILYVDTTVEVPITPTVLPALNLGGGDKMLVIGRNFDQGTTFDMTKPQGSATKASATAVRVLTPNLAVMTSPASPNGAIGVADLQAHNAFGDSNLFPVEYVAPPPPIILDVRNLDDGTQSAAIDGNKRLLIFGDGFFADGGALKVRLTGRDFTNPALLKTIELTGTSLTLVDDDILGVNIPKDTFLEGPLGIEVVTLYGSAMFVNAAGDPIFVLIGPQPPKVTGVFPRKFNSNGGEVAVLFGQNFTPTTRFSVRTSLMGSLVTVLAPRYVSETVAIVTMPALTGGMPPVGAPGLVRAEEIDAVLKAKITDPDFTESSLIDPLYVVCNDSAPALLAVYPDHGFIAGGEQVLLFGANFLNAIGLPNVTGVRIIDPVLGDVGLYTAATPAELPLDSLDPANRGKYFIVNDHTILLISNPRDPIVAGDFAAADVRLDSPAGAAILTGGYTYVDTPEVIAPLLLGITPNETRLNGGTSHLLSGAFLSGIHRIVFTRSSDATTFTIPLDGGDFSVVNSFFDVFVMPDLTAFFAAGDLLDVHVEKDVTGLGTLTSNVLKLALKVSFAGPPTITPTVTPVTGSAFGGTVVEIKGMFFTPQSQVLFGTMPARNVVFDSPTRIYAVTAPLPFDAGDPGNVGLDLLNVATHADPTVDVAAFTQGGWAVLADAYTFTPEAPALGALFPPCVSEGRTTRVTLTGARFLPGDTSLVLSGPAPLGVAAIVSVTSTEIVFDYTAPAYAPGTLGPKFVTFKAATSQGVSPTGKDLCVEITPFLTSCTTSYTVNDHASPTTGVEGGARVIVTILGGNFAGGASLSLDPRALEDIALTEVAAFSSFAQFKVVSPTKIEFTVPYAFPKNVPNLIDGNPNVGPVGLFLRNANGLATSMPDCFAYVPAIPDFEEFRFTLPEDPRQLGFVAPVKVTTGDINADGLPDAVMMTTDDSFQLFSPEVAVFFSDHFGAGVDVNGDGVVPDFAGTFTRFPVGNDTVKPFVPYDATGLAVRLAQLDADKQLEIVVPANVPGVANKARVLLIDVTSTGAIGTQTVLVSPTAESFQIQGIATGRFSSADSRDDIAFLTYHADSTKRVLVVFTSTATDFVFGSFIKSLPAAFQKYQAGHLAAGDFDGDGDEDLIWGQFWDDGVGIYEDFPILVAKVNAGVPSVDDPLALTNVKAGKVDDIEIFDTDGDALVDAVVMIRHRAFGSIVGPTTRAGGLLVVRKPLDLMADAYIELPFRESPTTLNGTSAASGHGDFDADGILDIAVTDRDGEFMILLGDGKGSFREVPRTWHLVTVLTYYLERVRGMDVADINGDGLAEVWMGDLGSTPLNLSLFLNQSR
ncbi:MAG: IPT/TIG domain-containing protein [Planctomycetaceae bacterium]